MKPYASLLLQERLLKGCLKRRYKDKPGKQVRWTEIVEVKPIQKEIWDSGEQAYSEPMLPENPGVDSESEQDSFGAEP